jgi:putative transposase
MPIVPIGKLKLQVVHETANRQEFVEQLRWGLERMVREVISSSLGAILEEEVDRILGRAAYRRRHHSGERESRRAQCNGCRSRTVRDFRRNGHRLRGLETHWGHVRIAMPQVECQCGHAVHIQYQSVAERQRFWDDLELEIRAEYTRGVSLRSMKDRFDQLLGGSVGLRSLNERVQAIQTYAQAWQTRSVEDVPPVIRVDGIWVHLLLPSGQQHKDARGRQRRVKRSQRLPVLIAQGVWPAQGRAEILTWCLGKGEDQASWEDLLFQLRQMGIFGEQLALLVGDGSPGFAAARQVVYPEVPFQRCIFHKIRNVLQALAPPAGMPRKEFRDYQRPLLASLAQIWQAADEFEARERQQAFCQKWLSEQPAAVASLQRDFELTLTFYGVQRQAAAQGESWPAAALRTTSALERENREFRRRIRAAIQFQSATGLMTTLYQNLVFRQLRTPDRKPGEWATHVEHQIEESRLFLN